MKRLFMTALPFLLLKASLSNEKTSQSGSYEHKTISLFDRSAARAKRHYPERNIWAKLKNSMKCRVF
jgi:hypothetical protein